MKVNELKELLENLPNDMEIFVGCQGYSNYDFRNSKQFDDEDTIVKVVNGKLFIADSCYLEN